MDVSIKRIKNQNGAEIGTILRALIPGAINLQSKTHIENQLLQYVFTNLYPDQTIHIYREWFDDTPAILVLQEENNLEQETIQIP